MKKSFLGFRVAHKSSVGAAPVAQKRALLHIVTFCDLNIDFDAFALAERDNMIEELINWIKSTYPNGKMDIDRLESGNVVVSINVNDNFIEIEYFHRENAAGISLLEDHPPLFAPHDFAARNLSDAKKILLELIESNDEA